MPPQTIQKVGFEFTPLNKPGWYFTEDSKFSLSLGDLMRNPDLMVKITPLPNGPKFKNDESFIDFMKSNFSVQESYSSYLNTKVQNITTEEVSIDNSQCLKKAFTVIAIDSNKVGGSGINEDNEVYFCLHPQMRDVAYVIELRYRHLTEVQYVDFKRFVDDVLNNFNFIEMSQENHKALSRR